MIQFLVWGRVRIKIRVRVGVTFNVRVYHRAIVAGVNVVHSLHNQQMIKTSFKCIMENKAKYWKYSSYASINTYVCEVHNEVHPSTWIKGTLMICPFECSRITTKIFHSLKYVASAVAMTKCMHLGRFYAFSANSNPQCQVMAQVKDHHQRGHTFMSCDQLHVSPPSPPPPMQVHCAQWWVQPLPERYGGVSGTARGVWPHGGCAGWSADDGQLSLQAR